MYIYTEAGRARVCVYNAYRAVILYARARGGPALLNEKPKYTGRRVGITPIGGYLSDKQADADAGAGARSRASERRATYPMCHAANGKMYTYTGWYASIVQPAPSVYQL